MKHFATILGHEVRMLLVSAGTYVAAALFFALMGFIFAYLLDDYSKAPQEASPAGVFFQLFWVPACFMVPLLTMRCLAEERRLGTLETLLSAPVTAAEVVLAKFSAAYLLYVSLWGATGGFFLLLRRYAGDARFLDAGPLVGGYVFIALSGLLFVALGVLASALTRSQAVAGLISGVGLFVLIIGFRAVVENFPPLQGDTMRSVRELLDQAVIMRHLGDFTAGIIDGQQVIFYLSSAGLALVLGVFAVEARQIHS